MGLIVGVELVSPSRQSYWVGLKGTSVIGGADNSQEAYRIAQLLLKTGGELEIRQSLRYMSSPNNGYILKTTNNDITLSELEELSLGKTELPKIFANKVEVDGGAQILMLPS